MAMKQESTKSKVFKSTAQKKAASDRNKANGALRASLHSQKSSAGNAESRAGIQRQIDAIGAGKRV